MIYTTDSSISQVIEDIQPGAEEENSRLHYRKKHLGGDTSFEFTFFSDFASSRMLPAHVMSKVHVIAAEVRSGALGSTEEMSVPTVATGQRERNSKQVLNSCGFCGNMLNEGVLNRI